MIHERQSPSRSILDHDLQDVLPSIMQWLDGDFCCSAATCKVMLKAALSSGKAVLHLDVGKADLRWWVSLVGRIMPACQSGQHEVNKLQWA